MIMMSHEQIRYIDRVLMPEGRKLTPEDPDKKALVEKYVELGAMNGAEVLGVADPWQAWMCILPILYSIHFFKFLVENSQKHFISLYFTQTFNFSTLTHSRMNIHP